MNLKLNIYEEDMKTVKKEVTANLIKIPFGIIRKLMVLFNVENLKDSSEILNVIIKCWDDVILILDRIFKDVEEDEWMYIDTNELINVIFKVIKESGKAILKIPSDSKNSLRER